MLLTNAQVSKLRQSFTNRSSVGITLSSRLLGPLVNTGLPLLGNVLKPLAKSILIQLGLTAAALAIDPAIHKEMFGSGNATLIILLKKWTIWWN